ncbi:unnamed protein product [Knipowitschia caucasica]|uniref:Uncharacterized protein n=1 Tax=Knipowitschia caucasica TaxID=637954 RepID=A0AAV2L141_KNICA
MKGAVSGFLYSIILFSLIPITSSMSLDLTELRNKVSNIKVNPRGNLWATGHFMGKKSVVDSSSVEALSSRHDTNHMSTVLLQLHQLQQLMSDPKRSLQTRGNPA